MIDFHFSLFNRWHFWNAICTLIDIYVLSKCTHGRYISTSEICFHKIFMCRVFWACCMHKYALYCSRWQVTHQWIHVYLIGIKETLDKITLFPDLNKQLKKPMEIALRIRRKRKAIFDMKTAQVKIFTAFLQ